MELYIPSPSNVIKLQIKLIFHGSINHAVQNTVALPDSRLFHEPGCQLRASTNAQFINSKRDPRFNAQRKFQRWKYNILNRLNFAYKIGAGVPEVNFLYPGGALIEVRAISLGSSSFDTNPLEFVRITLTFNYSDSMSEYDLVIVKSVPAIWGSWAETYPEARVLPDHRKGWIARPLRSQSGLWSGKVLSIE